MYPEPARRKRSLQRGGDQVNALFASVSHLECWHGDVSRYVARLSPNDGCLRRRAMPAAPEAGGDHRPRRSTFALTPPSRPPAVTARRL
jgi:hypothetical protein